MQKPTSLDVWGGQRGAGQELAKKACLELKLGQLNARIFSRIASPLKLAYQMLYAFLVLRALDAGEADAPKFQWCIDNSLLHLSDDAQCGEDGVLEDNGHPFVLCGRKGGEGEWVRNDWVDPGLQSKPGFPCRQCASTAKSLGQGSRIADSLAELMGLTS